MHLYGLPLLAVRFAVTLVVATASYYLVELPIRQGRGCLPSPSGGGGWSRPAPSSAWWPSPWPPPCRRRPRRPGPYRRPVRRRAGRAGQGDRPGRLGGLAPGLRPAGRPARSSPTASTSTTAPSWPAASCGAPQYRAHGVARPDGRPSAIRPPRQPTSGRPSGQGTSTSSDPNVVMVLAGRWEVMDRSDRRPVVAHR